MGNIIDWKKEKITVPDSAVNFALSANGASAKASACSGGFKPDGAINGNRSLKDWGHGNGWQAPSPNWHPNWWGEWIEIDFAATRSIDTILIFAFPAFVAGRFWRGLKDFNVQYLNQSGEWYTVSTIADNDEECIAVRFDEVETSSIRVWVTRNHYPEEKGFEKGFSGVNESPRIIEIEAYRLGGCEIFQTEKASVEISKGEKGSIALFYDEGFAAAVSPVDEIAAEFRANGYGVTLLNAEEVCEPLILNKRNFDIFVHPYGKYVPLGINLFDFLQEGGHLITIGGRAFTSVKQKINGIWCDLEMDPEITASAGRYNDAIRPYREQLGIFTIPHSRLKYVSSLKASPNQNIIDNNIEIDSPVEGWAAYGMTGELLPIDESAVYKAEGRINKLNHDTREGINGNRSENIALWDMNENYPPLFSHPCARWIPLINSYDAFERERGPIGAVISHYEGFYRGSNWAFFGVDNQDLFKYDGMRKALVDVADYLQLSVCLHDLEPEYVCYRQGEEVRLAAVADNCGSIARDVRVSFEIFQTGEAELPVYSSSVKVTVRSGGWEKVEASWKPDTFQRDMYKIKAVLEIDNKVIDNMENGFVVWNEEILAQGPKVEFKNNYFNYDGVPRYVVGARDSGLHLPGQPEENPVGWDRQYRTMREYGMKVTSPVHIDWLIPGLGWGELNKENPIPEVIMRRLDAQIQLAQKYGLIYAPGLFFAYENQAIKDPEVTKIICEAVGKRYTKVPGIMFYLADDMMKHIPEVFNDWAKTCVDALNSSGRTYIITNEFGFRQDWPDALRYSSKYLTFNSGSNFQRAVGDPVYDRLVDMRPAGKSFSYAEFVRRIPAGTMEDFYGYMAPPHLSFGMGYALALNWKWSTSYHTIWPSDVVFPGNKVPKDHLIAFRNEALFFRQFEPVYRPPEMLVVMPSSIWLKNTDAVTRYLVAFLRRLMEMNVDFACIDDTDLELLPKETKALIYPVPMEMSEDTYNRILDFVHSGGEIFITGDIARLSCDEPGTASRQERLNELCGLNWKGYAYASLSKAHSIFNDRYLPRIQASDEASQIKTGQYTAQPWINIEPDRAEAVVSGENGMPIVTRAVCGSGKVWFTPDMNPVLPKNLWDAYLSEAGIKRNRFTPDMPTLYCFKTDTLTGPVYTLITFPWDSGRKEVEVETEAGKVQLILKDLVLGVVHVIDGGGIGAVEAQGDVAVNGKLLLKSDTHVMLSSLDGKELSNSASVLVYPIRSGKVGLKNDLVDCVEIGEVKDGCWRSYGMLEASLQNGLVFFEMDQLSSTTLLLLYRHGERDNAVLSVETALNR